VSLGGGRGGRKCRAGPFRQMVAASPPASLASRFGLRINRKWLIKQGRSCRRFTAKGIDKMR